MDISKDISTEISEETAAETPKNRKGDGFKRFLNKLVGGDEQNVSFHFVLIMFFALFGMSFAFSFFPKNVSIYNDELFYMNIARNIANGDGPVVDVLGKGFDKILYSLLLAPTFIVKDAYIRMYVISALNCLVIASSVFPVWLIGKSIELNKKSMVVTLLITLVFPEFAACAMFMSEVLYIPLVLWFIYAWMVCSKKPSIKNGAILGAVGYLCYFTKEVFLAIPVACVALEVLYPLIAYRTRDDESQPAKLRSFYSSKKFIALGVFLVVFVCLNFAVKLTIFSNSQSLYSASGALSGLFNGYNFWQAVYQVLYYVAAVMISVLIVPAVYPIFRYKALNDTTRKLYCFCVISLMATIGVIVLTVGRTEMGSVTVIRILSRYFSSLVLLMLILFVKSVETDLEADGKKHRAYWGFMLMAAIIPSFIFRGAIVDKPDTMLFDVYRNFKGFVGELTQNEEQTKEYFDNFIQTTPGNSTPNVIPLYAILYTLILVVFVVVFHALYTRGRGKEARLFSFSFLIIIMFANLMSSYGTLKISQAYSQTISDTMELDDYFEENAKGANVLYILGDKGADIKRAMDTYLTLSGGQHIYPIESSSIDMDKMRENDFQSDKIDIEYLYFSEMPEPLTISEYDYIVTDINTNLKTNKLAGVEKIPLNAVYLTLYKNLDPSTVMLELDESKAFSGDNLKIKMYMEEQDTGSMGSAVTTVNQRPNAPYYTENGTKMSETGCFDVADKLIRVKVPVLGDHDELSVRMEMVNDNGGYQSCVVYQGDDVIAKKVIYGYENMDFTVKVKDGYLTFDIILDKMPVFDFYTHYELPEGYKMCRINSIEISAKPFAGE